MSGGSGGEPERRLKKAMDKLYFFPKSRPSALRKLEMGAGFGIEAGSRIPAGAAGKGLASGLKAACRPWDRSDLMRRLASFKAMSWFAKPKVVSPVNCARRGWTNVEPDVIVCEACGSRLMFSTPSSWTTQQVDKAAAVFSLKLDNGHKLLCPWVDNICDESLALFPPTPPQRLVQNFNECMSSLLRIRALPKISSSALDYMNKSCPQLEEILAEPVSQTDTLKRGLNLTDGLQGEELEGLFDDAGPYYQSLKIISICGWEPRQLPYYVECRPKAHTESSHTISSKLSEKGCNAQEVVVPVYHLDGNGHDDEVTAQDDDNSASVVLDCRFCGACVALWSFSMLERPLQLFKLISASMKQEPTSADADSASEAGCSKETMLTFNFSIAGGPPATRQTFRPTVSFPLVSRHFKAEMNFGRMTGLPEVIRAGPEVGTTQNEGHAVVGALKRKRSHDGLSADAPDSSDLNASSTEVERDPNLSDENAINNNSGQTKDISGELTLIASEGKDSDNASTNLSTSHEVENTMTNGLTLSSNHEMEGNSHPGCSGKCSLYDRMDELDPIKQHRTFCPWVASDDGKSLPGWRLVVSALLSQDNGSASGSAPRRLLYAGENPVDSVRKLFLSPPPKRFKATQ